MSDAAAFDLVIRDADIATAADRFTADIGVRDGRIVALGSGLARGASEIDAGGQCVCLIDHRIVIEAREIMARRPRDFFAAGRGRPGGRSRPRYRQSVRRRFRQP